MSKQLVSHSPDLLRLQEEGFPIAVRGGHLLMEVPYLDAHQEIRRGFLVSELTLSGERTERPSTHVVSFVGSSPNDLPHDHRGAVLDALINQRAQSDLGFGLVASCTFSQKPAGGYNDYYEKMTTYAEMLLGYVHAVDSEVPLRTYPPIAAEEDESAFRYLDSATSRAGIGAVNDKLRGQKVAIVGLGGTGSYVLDAVAKTPVSEIHLFDGDVLLTHNAFRAPCAPTLDELKSRPLKVAYHQRTYDAMHRHVIAHGHRIDESNVVDFSAFDFVFLALDTGPVKLEIVKQLQACFVPFVDTGMGVYQRDNSLGGIVRTTVSHRGLADPMWINQNVSFADQDDDEYDQNIQIAELNMLNAAFAVIMWKKHFGFYLDFEGETSSSYTIDGNHMLNEGATDED